MSEEKPKRRWFRFSLRTLLVLVTLTSAGFGWLGVKVRQAQRQKESVEAIRKMGSLVAYDYQFDSTGNTIVGAPTPPGPIWLRNLVGDDFFANVTCVRSIGPSFTDAEMVHVEAFPRLQGLHFYGTKTTNESLVHLRGLTRLEYLGLSGKQVTDDWLVHLEGFVQLKRLWLEGTGVTDDGCQKLQKALPNLVIER